jgi:hypothetical protein
MGIGTAETVFISSYGAPEFQVVPRGCKIAGGSLLHVRQMVSTKRSFLYNRAHSTSPSDAFAIAEPTLCGVNLLLLHAVHI